MLASTHLNFRQWRLHSQPYLRLQQQHTLSLYAGSEAARERTLGLNNRILAGMLLHTWRATDQPCPSTRCD